MKKLVLIAIAMLVAVGAFAQVSANASAGITLTVQEYVAVTTADVTQTVQGNTTGTFNVPATAAANCNYNITGAFDGTVGAAFTTCTLNANGTPTNATVHNAVVGWDTTDLATVIAADYTATVKFIITSL